MCSAFQELKQLPLWVVWRKATDKKGNPTKPPYHPVTYYLIDPTNPGNLVDFDTAYKTYQENSNWYDGVGTAFMKDFPITGIDLDHVIDPQTGEIIPWAKEIIDTFASYTEFSPNDGIHILVKGKIPKSRIKKKLPGNDGNNANLEIHPSDRYFTFTLNSYHENPLPIEDRQEALTALFQQYFTNDNPDSTDPKIQQPEIPVTQKKETDVEIVNAIQNDIDGATELIERGVSKKTIQLINTAHIKSERSEKIYEVLIELTTLGFSDEEIHTVISSAPIGEKANENGANWLQSDIDRVRKKKNIPSPTTNWPVPKQVSQELFPEKPYPIDAFPKIPREAVIESQAYDQQPMALVATASLAAISLACQGLADIKPRPKLQCAISLFVLVIALSGERKTAADRTFSSALRQWESEKLEKLKPELVRLEIQKKIHEKKCKTLEKELDDKTGIDLTEATKVENELVSLKVNKPKEIFPPSLFYEDVTTPALIQSMESSYPSTALWSDEGGVVTGGVSMGRDNLGNTIGNYNKLWDAGVLKIDRKTTESNALKNRRFTCNIMIQPKPFQKFLKAQDGTIREQGLLARFLMAWPISTMGSRFIDNSKDHLSEEELFPCMQVFNARIAELMEHELNIDEEGEIKPPVLKLSSDANKIWTDYANCIEAQIKPGGRYQHIGADASKNAQHAARIAGCFHVLEHGPTGDVSKATISRAITISNWYLEETRRIFNMVKKTEAVENAESLLEWLAGKDGDRIKLNDILQNGPSPVRDSKIRDAAVDLLERSDWVKRVMVKNTAYLEKSPHMATYNQQDIAQATWSLSEMDLGLSFDDSPLEMGTDESEVEVTVNEVQPKSDSISTSAINDVPTEEKRDDFIAKKPKMIEPLKTVEDLQREQEEDLQDWVKDENEVITDPDFFDKYKF